MFFFNNIKHKRITNRINLIFVDGKAVSNPILIQDAFLSFYSNLLCSTMENRKRVNMQVINAGPILSSEKRDLLDLSFTSEENKEALSSIDDNKAPGLDGFNSKFYKSAWPVIRDDIVEAIQSFFRSGKLLRSWNVTPITLIPKIRFPSTPRDFRPISCCQALYKCTSKLLCSRLKLELNDIICQTQRAFVAGRNKSHNILFC